MSSPLGAPTMQWRRELSWTPRDLGWRIAVLFMVGSFLFALGSFPAYSQFVDGRILGITFVIGSVFFTAAGYSAFFQVINQGRASGASPRFVAWSPRPTVWWAALIQLIGTVWFNINTVNAMSQTFSVQETNRLVWAPDFIGCIAFLLASHLYWLDVCGRLWCRKPDSPDWWGALLNYIGSIAFMAAALGSFTLNTTGETLNIALVNTGTFLGAVCFLVGAYLLLPPAPMRQDRH